MTEKSSKFHFRNFIIIFSLLAFISLIVSFLPKSSEDKKTDNFSEEKTSEVVEKQLGCNTSPEIPEELTFATEAVPVENFDVHESLDREMLVNCYWHSSTFLTLKRANRFFPVIEPILKKNGVPDDFKYLAVAESGLQNVTSPAGAKGFWQFMKATAIAYGMTINSEVDERYNLEKSTEAACKYLSKEYKHFKSWPLVAAAYNAGPSRIKKELNRQKVESYYDLKLNSETSRYVYRILAIKLIFQNPSLYGFCLNEKDLYPEYKIKKVVIDSTLNSLIDFAKNNNTNYKVIKELNPWLISDKLSNKSKKKYQINIPDDEGRKLY